MVAIPNGYAQVNFRFSGSALPNGAEVTLAISTATGPDTPEEVAEVLGDLWDSTILFGQSSFVVHRDTLVKFGPTATGPSATHASGLSGEAAATTVPPNVAYLVRKQTALGGRSGRGRMYVPGANEATITAAGVVDPATRAAQQGLWDDFLEGMETALILPVVLHGPGAPISAPTPITAFTVDASVATQRRRLRP